MAGGTGPAITQVIPVVARGNTSRLIPDRMALPYSRSHWIWRAEREGTSVATSGIVPGSCRASDGNIGPNDFGQRSLRPMRFPTTGVRSEPTSPVLARYAGGLGSDAALHPSIA